MMKTTHMIKQDVQNELYWDYAVPSSQIDVQVEQDKVILKGEVPSYFAKQRAEQATKSVWGVLNVQNDLVVDYPAKVPTDADLLSSIGTLLSLNDNLNNQEIEVSITNGVVKFEGTVDAYWKKAHLENFIEDLSGVRDIQNLLAVVPGDGVVDETIASEIMDAIDRKLIENPSDITVYVSDGKVTLNGKVPSYADWTQVYDAAVYTVGVKDVEDKVRIELPSIE